MPTTTLNIMALGPVVFAQSNRAKRISISVRPFRPIRVAFPRRISIKKAKKFLHANLDWAGKSLKKAREAEERHKTALKSRPNIPKEKAKAILRNRLQELADKHGFTYNRVFIRNQKTKWGSCSARNNINLNINLALLPGELRDYVILHELAHTRIKNHSKEFWAQMDGLVGDAKRLKKQMRKCILARGQESSQRT